MKKINKYIIFVAATLNVLFIIQLFWLKSLPENCCHCRPPEQAQPDTLHKSDILYKLCDVKINKSKCMSDSDNLTLISLGSTSAPPYSTEAPPP